MSYGDSTCKLKPPCSTYLQIALELVRASSAGNSPGGSLDLKGGVARDLPLEELLQPQNAQPAVFETKHRRLIGLRSFGPNTFV